MIVICMNFLCFSSFEEIPRDTLCARCGTFVFKAMQHTNLSKAMQHTIFF